MGGEWSELEASRLTVFHVPAQPYSPMGTAYPSDFRGREAKGPFILPKQLGLLLAKIQYSSRATC